MKEQVQVNEKTVKNLDGSLVSRSKKGSFTIELIVNSSEVRIRIKFFIFSVEFDISFVKKMLMGV